MTRHCSILANKLDADTFDALAIDLSILHINCMEKPKPYGYKTLFNNYLISNNSSSSLLWRWLR